MKGDDRYRLAPALSHIIWGRFAGKHEKVYAAISHQIAMTIHHLRNTAIL